MPVFALVVWVIVMIGSMEKQPKFLDGATADTVFKCIFFGLFGLGVVVSLGYMLLRFWELLGNYWFPFSSQFLLLILLLKQINMQQKDLKRSM